MKLWPSFLPREDRFFVYLDQSASNLSATARKLQWFMDDYTDVSQKWREIKHLEEAGDTIIHTIMTTLHKTFITPLDREDIAALGERMDDIVDSIEEAARTMMEYRIEAPTEASKQLTQIIVQSAETLEEAIHLLHNKGDKLKDILPLASVINTLENEADRVTSQATAELFNSDVSPIYVLKWKEIYGLLELATDFCEDAANKLEGIVLKHA